ncbi:MAG: hypothetical protein GX568_04245 [Candidatus Gastranaerophilales bacterium]|nr:hypothetical protein [Candidatus Gastranaerophilales bacterium]
MNILDSVDSGLMTLPMSELQSMKKRVDFYVEHYSTIKRSRKDDITYNDRIIFLSNLNKLLENEIKSRL